MLTKLMTPREVTEFYKISEGTLKKYRVYGKGFKYVKIGGKVFYKEEDIENYIAQHTYCSTSQRQSGQTYP